MNGGESSVLQRHAHLGMNRPSYSYRLSASKISPSRPTKNLLPTRPRNNDNGFEKCFAKLLVKLAHSSVVEWPPKEYRVRQAHTTIRDVPNNVPGYACFHPKPTKDVIHGVDGESLKIQKMLHSVGARLEDMSIVLFEEKLSPRQMIRKNQAHHPVGDQTLRTSHAISRASFNDRRFSRSAEA